MRAAIATAYGPPAVVRIGDVPKPVAGRGEVLVRIHAASVSAGDWRLRSGVVPAGFGPFIRLALGIRRLRQPILGNDFSGVVEAVGEGVTRFKAGDAIFGSAGMGMGCHSEYRVFKETAALALKPENLSHLEAAAMPFGAQAALGFLQDKAALKPGERLLVIGGSGAVGSAAVQLGRAMGAEVTAVTSSRNADLVRSLGAQKVIAYDRTPLVTAAERYDVIADTVGEAGHGSLRPLLADGGRLAAIAASLPELLRAIVTNPFSRKRILVGDPGESAVLMNEIATRAQSSALRPLIDSVFSFDDIVKAHARVDTRRKVGAVVLDMMPCG